MAKFYSDNPFLFIRHDNIGYKTPNIHEYNTGIQFKNGVYETNDFNTIKALRNYVNIFLKKGIRPPVWEEGQLIDQELTEPIEVKGNKVIHNITDYKTILNNIADSIRK
ncbi:MULTISPECIES: hypothetical protein [Ureibacillus]|jgi:hypothetical protein|uniref:Uncharacterized protein n=1 Tax=Ureibacillus thermosphaericus TaxID=51173 RepID=A0A840PPD4_URETH|nr:hypothetical protein [Ureibacillus thermosphaericus]MBB5150275.1 hypothetical protein [Ureibacillus thermosphaericus]NKZ32886.1 hypothetical protein [Ureibacillus thermosphaericus]